MAHSSLVQTPRSKTSGRIVGVQEAVRMNPSRVELSSFVINCLVGGNVTDLRTDRPSASNVGLPDLARRATEASSERPQVLFKGCFRSTETLDIRSMGLINARAIAFDPSAIRRTLSPRDGKR
ncbi:hypothetical protein [Hydrogenophaga sp.]|uniref:hypothetical protein n=1 Tax=Hydrogenophaga sp. TaxID=1904254 RepID=UPI00286E644F|nr:hypothetical protein [Hydrogenophaga sp.]